MEHVIRYDKVSFVALDSNKKYCLTTDKKRAVRNSLVKMNNIMNNSLGSHIDKSKCEVVPYVAETKIQSLTTVSVPAYSKLDMQKLNNALSVFEEQACMAKGNEDYLNKELSNLDKEISDVLHYIEFYKFNAAEGYKLAKLLKTITEKRRDVKNELKLINIIKTHTLNMAGDGKTTTAIKALGDQKYNPRILTSLFEREKA